MRTKTVISLFVILSWVCLSADAHAGAIRTAGKMIGRGSTKFAEAAAAAGGAFGGGATKVRRDAGDAAKSGAGATANGVKAFPGVAANTSKTAANAVWKVIW